ncbi:hypothetical protein NE237_010633 [Protea cynaroides]|uniref:Uncharacterized protein n=1 Tax=Protea cynaroides TaxID=273540 RepID=A0A9Q0KZQ4_9MAGN|nr:hypothetical protein NE237_010633 [Protea cynaroides]
MEQIPETLPERILEKMKAPPKADDLSAKLSLIPSMSSGILTPSLANLLASSGAPVSMEGARRILQGPKKSEESLVVPIPDALTSTTNPGVILHSEVPRETPDLSLFSPKPRTVDSNSDVDLGSKRLLFRSLQLWLLWTVIPLNTQILISNFKLAYNLLSQLDGTFNSHLTEFLDCKISANTIS